MLIDEKFISKEISYTAQQKSSKIKFPKICRKEYIFGLIAKKASYKTSKKFALNLFLRKDFDFYSKKLLFLAINPKIYSFRQIFGNFIFLDFCWAV